MDCQPEHKRAIVQIDRAYIDKDYWHCPMGLRKYEQNCTFQECLDFCRNNDLKDPDFFWVYAEDFPFPERPKNVKDYS
jgi:hypothetical protein